MKGSRNRFVQNFEMHMLERVWMRLEEQLVWDPQMGILSKEETDKRTSCAVGDLSVS